MTIKVLIADHHLTAAQNLAEELRGQQMQCDYAAQGRETQLKIFQNDYACILINYNLKAHSAVEVLHYIKQTKPFVRVILLLDDGTTMNEENLNLNLPKLGINMVMKMPLKTNDVVNAITGNTESANWKTTDIKNGPIPESAQEIQAADTEFISLPIKSFHSGHVVCFDLYLRLNTDKYLLLMYKGEAFDANRIEQYIRKGVESFYIKNRDRMQMLNYYNQLTSGMSIDQNLDSQTVTSSANVVASLLVDEILTNGLNPEVLKEAGNLIETTIKLVQRKPELNEAVKMFHGEHPTIKDHNYLSMVYTVAICKNLDWVSNHSLNDICLAALLQDIGLMSENKDQPYEMSNFTDEQAKRKYQLHPKRAYASLHHYNVSEKVRQAILQHHERWDGEGFPSGISNARIYPPAQIIYLASRFADLLLRQRLGPIKCLNNLVQDAWEVQGCGKEFIVALLKSFIKEKTKKNNSNANQRKG